eukprot:CAMPEP_0177254392 /NCGR_PEP_ID=MMETSP0367-20130122/55748_1 /TAXON_ID=447022 ORGANISM="Scrippsiella hangoei-like, Strain SHHI-4" /NCGR_SAMPLE_ID=MMETSP0367 /ASSEMBLY_ACC=CAM_ASM_000362 /LENGTH=126 /DNA_ID=CAMNT_0018707935 /DNA_START=27 /DNA_END=404 /DNA_ORIENTATION=+
MLLGDDDDDAELAQGTGGIEEEEEEEFEDPDHPPPDEDFDEQPPFDAEAGEAEGNVWDDERREGSEPREGSEVDDPDRPMSELPEDRPPGDLQALDPEDIGPSGEEEGGPPLSPRPPMDDGDTEEE